jgi:hypothetical protein
MPETLTQRLADAARAAILDQRPALEHPAGGVCGMIIEWQARRWWNW